MSIDPPVCLRCKHFRGAASCDAFPQKIPDLIFLEGDPHTERVPGDHGIRFEPRAGPAPDRRS
jgi:hypothetical protein